MKISVEEIIDNQDGSADYIFSMDLEAMMIFAKVGLTALLEEAARKYGYTDPEGTGDTSSGEGSNSSVSG